MSEFLQRPMLIDGELVPSRNGRWIDSINPATEERIGQTPEADARDMARAVDAAQRAQRAWAERGVAERGELLRAAAAALLARRDEILAIEVRDTGNTIAKMGLDVSTAAEALVYFAGLGLELKGETIPATAQNLHFTLREPYGVVGRIVPFNHPILFAASRIAAPLLAGNAVVVKPPETSPLSAAIFAEICREVFPPGVVNLVTGLGPVAGDALVRHPAVKRIAFIGSVETGRSIQRAAAETGVKHVTLELGGKNPMIVFPDVDPERAATAALAGMNFAWQGQSCGSTSRLFLHEEIYEAVLDRVVAAVVSLRMGDPLDPASEVGPLHSAAQRAKTESYVDAGRREGAKLVCGGRRPPGSERGFWFEPTVFADVDMGMRIAREEIFGPVLSVLRWSELDAVVEAANATEYGLTASIWTDDLNRALGVARRVQAGYVWINGQSTHFQGTPFGGKKASGIGREEALGELLSYTELKTVHVMLR